MRKTRWDWGETGPLSQVVRVLFSLCSFKYVPTKLSERLAQASNRLERVLLENKAILQIY